MPHFPQGYRADDLDLPVNPVITVMQPELREEPIAADQGDAAYLCSHGLGWPAEHPDDPERTGRPMVEH
jgi:hypothetical protein